MTIARTLKGRGQTPPVFVAVPRNTNHTPDASAEAVEQLVRAIKDMSLDQLRAEWASHFSTPVPRCRSKEVVRGLLAWRIQAEVFGGMSVDTTRRLRRLSEGVDHSTGSRHSPATRGSALKPGTVLTREWRGAVYKVHVLNKGFAYAGRTYSNLSEIACSITGTHWSGPRFFGLSNGRSARATVVGRAGS